VFIFSLFEKKRSLGNARAGEQYFHAFESMLHASWPVDGVACLCRAIISAKVSLGQATGVAVNNPLRLGWLTAIHFGWKQLCVC
jgi:hypothetical protein